MFTKEAQELAKPCYQAIKKISKGKWEWEPKRGEWFLTKYAGDEPLLLIEHITPAGLIHSTVQIKTPLVSYALVERSPNEVIALLHWERIEEILEGMGYRLALYAVYHPHKADEWGARIDKESCPQSYGNPSKTRQLAVMRAVIELGKEV